MSIQDKFWKKPTAPLEHVASMEAEHKPNTLSTCLLTSAKDLTRWIWDQCKPLKTTESSDFREQEHTLFCTKPKGRRTLWQGRDSVSHPNPCLPTQWPGTVWPFMCTDKNPCHLAISLQPAELFREQRNNTALQ